jgi:PKD repeat protein
MKKNITIVATICMLLFSSSLIAPAIAKAEEQKIPYYGGILYVGGSGPNNYTLIQDAIDNASNGDTVFVYNGTYYENIVIDRRIDLIGEDKEITVINATGTVVTISSDYVNMSGFTIENTLSYESLKYYDDVPYYYWSIPDAYGDDFFNMRFTPYNTCTLTTCLLNFYEGGSFVNTNEGVDIIVWDDNGSGFPDTELARINVHPDDIDWYPNQTEVDFSSFNLVFNSDFHIGYTTVNQTEDVYAILSDDGTNGTNRSSEYYNGNWSSIWEDWGVDVNFFITANVSCKGLGIYVVNSSNNSIFNTTIKNCDIGLLLEQNSDDNLIHTNNFTNNNLAVKVTMVSDTSDDNMFYHNNFVNNDQHASDSGSNIWNDSYPSGGNYWDDYTGEDNYSGPEQNITGSDGIGDTPYDIPDGSNKDYYPLMFPYGQEEVVVIIITIEDPLPEDGNTSVNISQPTVSVDISAISQITFENSQAITPINFDWEIGGDNVTKTSADNDSAGRKEANIIGPLDYSTSYTWYVNVTAGGEYTNVTFYFTTENAPNQAPVADFNYSAIGLIVDFNASESYDQDGNIVNYTWDFGDGNTTWNSEPLVNHTYGKDGNYSVTLTVTDDKDAIGDITKYVNVTNLPPVANFIYSVFDSTVILESTSVDPDGTIANWTWDFGDGNKSYTEKTNHTYAEGYKTYNVTLTVTDNVGATNTTYKNIQLGDNTKPKVEILKPIPKGIYLFNDLKLTRLLLPTLIIGPITIEVNATDEGGSGIQRVDFYIDPLRSFGKPVGNDTAFICRINFDCYRSNY